MKWLTFTPTQNQVPVTHQLRGEDPNTMHFTRGGQEYLAVHSTEPYGALDRLPPFVRQDLPLLDVVQENEDFTVLSVPEDLLTLQAIVMGTGRQKGKELTDVFRKVGGAIGTVLEHADPPSLRTSDIAISRRSGEVLFLPPLPFIELGSLESSEQVNTIQSDISGGLAKFQPSTSQQLLQVMTAEMNHGRSQ